MLNVGGGDPDVEVGPMGTEEVYNVELKQKRHMHGGVKICVGHGAVVGGGKVFHK